MGVAVLVLVCGTAQAWVMVGDWEFNGANWLDDSSGNGYNLINLGATQNPAQTTAVFNGNLMYASPKIDLSPYRQVRVSWRMQLADATVGEIWGQGYPEYIYAFASEVGPGVGDTMVRDNLGTNNGDLLPHATDGTWQDFVVEFDLDAALAADVVRVWIGGVEQADSTAWGCHNLFGAGYTFASDWFNIGARGSGGQGIVGELDYVRLEGIPEPATLGLLGLGSGALVWLRRRR